MFRLWRFAPVGHPYFKHDEVGDYFVEVMKCKRAEIGDEKHSKISKIIGWGK